MSRRKKRARPAPAGQAAGQPASPPGPEAAPVAGAPPRWRLPVLLGVLLLLAGLWVYLNRGPSVPEVPGVDLRDADPEVAAAVTRARDAVLRAPRSAADWGRLAMILHAHRYLREAATCYTATAALDDQNPFWPYMQALILLNGQEPAAAVPCLEQAARLTPPNSLPRLRLAGLFLEQGRLDEADAEFRKVLAAGPDDAHARLGLGQVAAARRQDDEALDHLRAVADNPFARKRACALLAAVYERRGDRAAADGVRRRLAGLPDDEPWPDDGAEHVAQFQVGLAGRLERARALQLQSQFTEAVRLLREAVEHYPAADAAWSRLGTGLGLLKDFPGAERALLKSIELAPGRADHWFYLGAARKEQRNYRAATEAFRKAAELRPTDAAAHYQVGECLEAQGDRVGAIAAFRAALRCRPDMAEARDRLARLKDKS